MVSKRKLQTIILDCDGVMFQSLEANRHYYNALLAHFGRKPMNEGELEYVHIHNVMDSVRHIFRHHDDDLELVHEYRKEISYHPFLRFMTIEPDLKLFLETTRSDYNLAIATNRTDTMDPLLEEFSLKGYFGKVMTASNSRRPKPAADPLLEILEHYETGVDEAIFVGDSRVDEETARNCGMRLVAFRNRMLATPYHIDSFSELMEMLPKL